MQIHPYLVFNGKSAEAMAFYQQVLGGKLDISRYSDIPDFDQHFKPEDGDRVMHARLQCDEATLMASDGGPGQLTGPMEGFSVALVFTDMARASHIFNGLAVGGSITMPWAPTFWADGFGMLKDQYGVSWMVNCGIAEGPDKEKA